MPNQQNQQQTIGIVWRPDGDGKGAYWDHFTIQQTTGMPTAIVLWADQSTQALRSYLTAPNEVRKVLAHGEQIDSSPHKMPPVLQASECDVLLIPGAAKGWGSVEERSHRQQAEEALLSEWYQKKPLILLCGGVWRLKALGMTVSAVEHHSNSKMVGLNAEHGRVINNTSVHELVPGDGAVARAVWGGDCSPFPVNSVHSDAVTHLGARAAEFEVVGVSGDPVLVESAEANQLRMRKDRAGNEMHSEKCIEAIISVRGPPLVAAQWHPEAYFTEGEDSPHRKLIMHAVSYKKKKTKKKKISVQLPTGDQLLSKIKQFARDHKLGSVKLNTGGHHNRTKEDIVSDIHAAWRVMGG